MNYGHLELRIEELLQEKGISKNMICKELDIPRAKIRENTYHFIIQGSACLEKHGKFRKSLHKFRFVCFMLYTV